MVHWNLFDGPSGGVTILFKMASMTLILCISTEQYLKNIYISMFYLCKFGFVSVGIIPVKFQKRPGL